MIQFFRGFFQSKVGIAVTLGFLALIGLAFALTDVSNTGTLGGISGGDEVAAVGDANISAVDLSTTVTSELERLRAQDPTMSMESFVARGGVTETLNQMIRRWAVADYAQDFGLRAGKRLVDSQIAANPQLRGPDGNFSQDVFRQALAQQGISEASIRQDIAQQMLTQQLVLAAGYGARMPDSITRRYAGLQAERRTGRVGALPAAAYAPTGDPTSAQLQEFYTANRTDYIRPERRIIRYASFGEDALGDVPAPADAQIAARYQRDIAKYRASETRGFTQLILPTQAAAQAVANEVRGGMSLEASARAKGLATAQIDPADKAALTTSSSAAVANAVFAAARGALAEPAQGSLGWYVVRVDSVDRVAARTLAQARAGIVTELSTELRRTALNEATVRIEEEMADGRSLAEVARELGVTLQSTPPITANGQIYGTANAGPQELAPIMLVAFEMEEGEPQLTETVPGQTFMIFDVIEITQSATAPLAEIREDVVMAWRRERGMEAAEQAATRVIARMDDGQTLVAALAAEQKDLPASQPVNMTRTELQALAQAQQGQLPPVLTLFFSMAEGTVKQLAQDENGSWFVLQLDNIESGTVPAEDAALANFARGLGNTAAGEYADQFVAAIEDSLGTEINQTAVDALVAQLTGRAN